MVAKLVENRVCNSDDFEWISQLRYYWENKAVNVKMITTTVNYAYEYLGNSGRLVITPLTDRCYRSVDLCNRDHAIGLLIKIIDKYTCNNA